MAHASSSAQAAKVLIVDDVPANLDLLYRTLSPQGYTILAAPNGDAALQAAKFASVVTPGASPNTPPVTATPKDLPLNLEQAELVLIKRALEQADGNVSKAAELLGVNRTRIYRLLPQMQPSGSS